MNRRLANFRMSVARHGLWPSLLRVVCGQLRRVVHFELCRVESSSGQPYDWPDIEDYETRAVTSEEFHSRLCVALRHNDYRWAFDRGDVCVASIADGDIVGYNFATRHPTQVQPGLVFRFAPGFSYSFASLTAPEHRGRKLERERWKVSRRVLEAHSGTTVRSIWYINVTNLESLAANRHSGVDQILWGYAGFARLFGRWLTWASPGCRKIGAGFEARPGS